MAAVPALSLLTICLLFDGITPTTSATAHTFVSPEVLKQLEIKTPTPLSNSNSSDVASAITESSQSGTVATNDTGKSQQTGREPNHKIPTPGSESKPTVTSDADSPLVTSLSDARQINFQGIGGSETPPELGNKASVSTGKVAPTPHPRSDVSDQNTNRNGSSQTNRSPSDLISQGYSSSISDVLPSSQINSTAGVSDEQNLPTSHYNNPIRQPHQSNPSISQPGLTSSLSTGYSHTPSGQVLPSVYQQSPSVQQGALISHPNSHSNMLSQQPDFPHSRMKPNEQLSRRQNDELLAIIESGFFSMYKDITRSLADGIDSLKLFVDQRLQKINAELGTMGNNIGDTSMMLDKLGKDQKNEFQHVRDSLLNLTLYQPQQTNPKESQAKQINEPVGIYSSKPIDNTVPSTAVDPLTQRQSDQIQMPNVQEQTPQQLETAQDTFQSQAIVPPPSEFRHPLHHPNIPQHLQQPNTALSQQMEQKIDSIMPPKHPQSEEPLQSQSQHLQSQDTISQQPNQYDQTKGIERQSPPLHVLKQLGNVNLTPQQDQIHQPLQQQQQMQQRLQQQQMQQHLEQRIQKQLLQTRPPNQIPQGQSQNQQPLQPPQQPMQQQIQPSQQPMQQVQPQQPMQQVQPQQPMQQQVQPPQPPMQQHIQPPQQPMQQQKHPPMQQQLQPPQQPMHEQYKSQQPLPQQFHLQQQQVMQPQTQLTQRQFLPQASPQQLQQQLQQHMRQDQLSFNKQHQQPRQLSQQSQQLQINQQQLQKNLQHSQPHLQQQQQQVQMQQQVQIHQQQQQQQMQQRQIPTGSLEQMFLKQPQQSQQNQQSWQSPFPVQMGAATQFPPHSQSNIPAQTQQVRRPIRMPNGYMPNGNSPSDQFRTIPQYNANQRLGGNPQTGMPTLPQQLPSNHVPSADAFRMNPQMVNFGAPPPNVFFSQSMNPQAPMMPPTGMGQPSPGLTAADALAMLPPEMAAHPALADSASTNNMQQTTPNNPKVMDIFNQLTQSLSQGNATQTENLLESLVDMSKTRRPPPSAG